MGYMDRGIFYSDSTIYFAKKHPDAKIPTKRDEDGCYDIYARFDENEIIIPAYTVKLIPTDICSAFSPKYRIAFRERGSNTKSNLKVSAGQIDSGFRGTWFVALHNDNNIDVTITKSCSEVIKIDDMICVPYSKAICQFAVEEVPVVGTKEINIDDLQSIPSERGAGALGSSGK